MTVRMARPVTANWMKKYICRKQPGTEMVLTYVRRPDSMLGMVVVV